MEHNLNVFRGGPSGRWEIWGRIKWFFRSIHCAWQRITKGFCYRDVWNLDTYYSKLFVSTLIYLKNNHTGCPNEFYDEENDSSEAWVNYLNEVATHFNNYLDEYEIQKNEYRDLISSRNLIKEDGFYVTEPESPEQQEISKKWFEREYEIQKWKEVEKDKGFEMLKKHFTSLWD